MILIDSHREKLRLDEMEVTHCMGELQEEMGEEGKA